MKSVVHFINVRVHFKPGYSESSWCQAGRIRLWHGLVSYIQCKFSDESFFPPKWYLKCVPFNTPHCKHRVIRTKFYLNIFIESILWEISIEIDWKFFGPNAQAPIHELIGAKRQCSHEKNTVISIHYSFEWKLFVAYEIRLHVQY